MLELENKQVLVIGLGGPGQAPCVFLRRSGARVTGDRNLRPITGGKDKGPGFQAIGPLLSKRVKCAFLVGEASKKIQAAWSIFTPCTVAVSLLEAIAEAAKNATSGGVVLLSPACSSWDQFRNHQHRGVVFCQAVKSIGGGVHGGTPNIDGKRATREQ